MLFAWMCVWAHACHRGFVEVRGQLGRLSSLLPSCGFPGIEFRLPVLLARTVI